MCLVFVWDVWALATQRTANIVGQLMKNIPEKLSKKGLELGINFFDTAIAYQSGTSEQYLGRAIKDFAKRDDVVIATKFLPRTNEENEAGITGQQHIERMLHKSLKNLGMDYVDLYIYHMWDHNTPLYDIMDGLNNVIKSGRLVILVFPTVLPISLQRLMHWLKKRTLQNSYPCRDIIT